MINKIKQAFNRAANTYNDACEMQHFAAMKLLQQIDAHIQHETIMDLGCGTGLITQHFLRRTHYQHCLSVDIADSALQIAKNSLTKENVHFMAIDFDQLNLPQSFSLIFSNMALHWSCDFATLLAKLHGMLQAEGLLAFTVPLQGTLIELQDGHKKEYYEFTDIIDLLNNHFSIQYAHQYGYTTLFTTHLAALHSLKNTGVTHYKKACHKKGLTGKNQIQSLFKSMQSPITLTYEIGVFIARKS